MSVTLDHVLQLAAVESGRAVRAASNLAVGIQPHALLLAPIQMAGEDGTIHAFAHGRRDRPPRFAFCPDPRSREAHHSLLEELGLVIGAHVRHARMTGGYPQIVVVSSAAAELLDAVSEATRFDDDHPRLRDLGNALSWFTERFAYAGQQTLVTATGLLSTHFRTGMAKRDEQHLLASLAWHEDGPDVHARVREAERIPMGTHTDPDLDRTVLAPLVRKHNAAKGDEREELARQIGNALASAALPMFLAIVKAIETLEDANLPPLPDLGCIQQVEQDAFDRFLAHLAGGGRFPKRDRARTATFRFENQEETIRNVEAALTLQDAYRREQARLDGRLTTVRVTGTRKDGRLRYVELESEQPRLLLRRLDSLVRVDSPNFTVEIVSVEGAGPLTRIVARVLTGMRKPGMPGIGDEFDLAEEVPDWQFRERVFAKVKRRTGTSPATVPTPTRPRPADLLAFTEGLA